MLYSVRYAINREAFDLEQERRIRYEIGKDLGYQLASKISDDVISGKLKSEKLNGFNEDVFTVRLHVLTDEDYNKMLQEAIRVARVQMERGEPLIFKLEEK